MDDAQTDEQEPNPPTTIVGDAIPEASNEQPQDIPPLVIGAPFAISNDCELLDRTDNTPGCAAIIECDQCQQKFRIDLLSEALKQCPKCHTAYTHMLLVAPAGDTDIIAGAMAQVMEANGYQVPDLDDDDPDVPDATEGGE